MNWKDYPNLFMNGNFQIKRNKIHKFYYYSYHYVNEGKSNLKLIARPISDMSIKEWETHYDLMINFGGDDSETPESFLYLLSIGVYPFDDDTDVIWRYENE